MNRNTCWLWLTTIQSISPGEINALYEHFGDAEEIYKATDYSNIPSIRPITKLLLRDKSLKRADKAASAAEKCGARILTFDDADYPDRLRIIESPPYVLYVKGEIMKWDRILGIGVVGTRHCSEYGIAAVNAICPKLAESGVTIVSGMARGIDALAARGALNIGAKTIAVLGCGIDTVYPPEHGILMRDISENGAVITEYPPGTKPLGKNFPWRNRIISGISNGILVIEAPKKSGALITADYALEQGKDVFAVPGSIFKKTCEGSNRLISEYAKAVGCAEDILENYEFELSKLKDELTPKKKSVFVVHDAKHDVVNNEIKITVEDKKYTALSEDEKVIVSLLTEGNMHIDDLMRRSGLDASKITPVLSMLEFGGFIKKIPGNSYKLNV